jgi:transforming growth factor-beta-induced protein
MDFTTFGGHMSTRIAAAVAVAAGLAVAGPAAAQQAAPAPQQNIVEVAQAAGTFQTLLAAAQAAGLVGVLTSEGPFTVFAPTDEAFGKLPAGTVEALLADPAKLAEILKYHVVPGRISAADVMQAGMAHPKTAQGAELHVRVQDGKVLVDNATVVAADIQASNGVIHVIDAVILPPAAR